MSPNRKPYDKGSQIPISAKLLAGRERFCRDRERERENERQEERKRQRQGRGERRRGGAPHSGMSQTPLKLTRKLSE